MIRAACLVLVLLLFGCETSDNSKTITFSDIAMTMPYRVIVAKPCRRADVQKIIDDTFAEINRIYNKWNPHSELSKLNRAAAGQKIFLSKELEHFLKETDRMVKLSHGKFDPTVEPLQQLWKAKLQHEQIPSPEEVEAAAVGVGWKNVHLEEGVFWKDFAETRLDLGGIAKGYGLDFMVKKLNQEGYPDVYVEWGGEIRTSGHHPEGRPWRVLVSKFGAPSSALTVVDLEDEAVASSGDYLQNWTVAGVTYFHIFDPETGRPLTAKRDTICSATVVAPNCMLADVLATVAMMFPSPEASKKWLREVQREVQEVKFWLLTRDGGQDASE